MLISWNIVAIFMLCLFLSLSEIASLYPSSGGLYYWVYEILSKHSLGKRSAPFLAFLEGWGLVLASVISVGVTNVIASLSIASILKLAIDKDITNYCIMVTALIITFIHLLINTSNIKVISFFNQLNMFWSILGFISIIVVLSLFASHENTEWIFTHYENQTGFDNSGYVLMLGMIGAAYSLIGSCDCVVSVSEETKDADISTPKAMILAFISAWFSGFVILIVFLFSIKDLEAILESTLRLPIALIFLEAVGTHAAILFLIFILVCQFCTGATTTTVASRQIYVLARDDATPFSASLSLVSAHSKLPKNAVLAATVLTSLVVMTFPLSDSIFETIVSATTITFHFCYVIVLGCRLIVPDSEKRKGRFNLGRWSRPVNIIGLFWAFFATLAFTLPTNWPITADDANYAGLSLVVVIGMTVLFWFGWGRHNYSGPKFKSVDTAVN
ncbi:amino acid transporter [Backusella circina FSU 941]|nr:amino acid transporter [Backusella circina FSU 941]